MEKHFWLLVLVASVAAFVAWMYVVNFVFTFWPLIVGGIVGLAWVASWFKPKPPDKIIEIRHR